MEQATDAGKRGQLWVGLVARVRRAWRGGLLAERDFRLMWLSSTVTSFGGQVTMLALPLTAVLLLDATPAQMGWLVAFETLPFSLFSLHAGVLLDRVRKRPILIAGEAVIGLALALIPLAAFTGHLSMPLLYAVGFVLGTAFVVYGSAAQIYLTQLAGRERLIEANSLFIGSESAARLTGPGLAGLLIQWLSAPVAILFDCLSFALSLGIFTRIRHAEAAPPARTAGVGREIAAGLALVWHHPVLRPLTLVSTSWFVVFQGWGALQTLYATRDLGLTAGELGAAHMVGGVGALLASVCARRLTRRLGTGVPILLGVAASAAAWIFVALLSRGAHPLATLSAALFLFDAGTTLYWINYASLRQAVTPDGMLGRMTATMRFFTVAPAPLGALIAGHVAETIGIRATFAGMGAAVMAMAALLYWRTALRHVPDVATMRAGPAVAQAAVPPLVVDGRETIPLE
jgi:predicted MFS family arabinose efflux permease